jgi:archaellum component FlaC
VCDGCFNSLCSQAIARNLALAKAKKNLESLRDDDLSTDDKGSADDVTGKGTKDVSNNRVNDIQNTLGNVGANLEERGEKLEQLAEKSERMENVRKLLMILYYYLCYN